MSVHRKGKLTKVKPAMSGLKINNIVCNGRFGHLPAQAKLKLPEEMRTEIMKRRSLMMGIAVALLAMLVMAQDVYGQNVSISSSRNGDRYRFTQKRGSNKLDIEYDGKIEFTEDDKGIESISRGGYLRIRKSSFGNRREVLAEAGPGGTVEYQFWIGRRRVDDDAEAREWLADVLVEVVRTTGIGAEGRVKRFYEKGGLDGVLNEVDDIRSDYVSSIYLREVLGLGLNDKELVKVAGYVPRELDSDHYITEVFKDYGDLFFKNEEATSAFLTSIRRMDSDHYKSIILKRALREELNDAMVVKVLDASTIMDSDHYKTTIYRELLDRRQLSDKVIDQIVKSAADIDSDHYATLVLKDALDRPNLSDAAFTNLMDAVSNIDSDHYVTETFKGMLRGRDVSDKIVEAIIERMQYMDSDHYRNVIISRLFEDNKISAQYFEPLLKTVEDMDSDHYSSLILKKVLREQDLTDENYELVLNKVGDMDSDHYKVTILKDILDDNLNKKQMISVLKAAEDIDSDYYKSEVLKEACRQMDDADDEVKDLYRDVARDIRSDTYYGRVARCIR